MDVCQFELRKQTDGLQFVIMVLMGHCCSVLLLILSTLVPLYNGIPEKFAAVHGRRETKISVRD
jgi:hypothetical protein